MIILLKKLAMLVLLLAAGYLCARLKIVGPEFNKGLSKLVINVLLPAFILSSVINKQLDLSRGEVAYGLLMMIVMMLICVAIGMLMPRVLGIKDGDTGMYRVLATFMNNGFMGFPLVAAIYGDTWVFFASLSNIPFNMLLYSLGVLQLQQGEDREKLNLKKIISTPLIATVIAIIIFSFEIPVPLVIEDTIATIGGATVPMSMMCVGITLAGVPIKDAFVKPRLYIVSFIRLLIAPLAVWLVLRFFTSDPTMLGIIVVIAACPSAVMCSILGIKYGRDGVEASEAIFLNTVLSVLTMPLLLLILGL